MHGANFFRTVQSRHTAVACMREWATLKRGQPATIPLTARSHPAFITVPRPIAVLFIDDAWRGAGRNGPAVHARHGSWGSPVAGSARAPACVCWWLGARVDMWCGIYSAPDQPRDLRSRSD